jgi:hypothetical protein
LGLFCNYLYRLFAILLDFAEFGESAGEDAEGGGAGAFDGFLGLFDIPCSVFEPDGLFNGGATAQAPGGVDDFGGKRFFDGACGGEVGLVGVTEIGVDFGFLAEDEVTCGEQSSFNGVAGDAGFALVSDGALTRSASLRLGIAGIRPDQCLARRVAAVGDQLRFS